MTPINHKNRLRKARVAKRWTQAELAAHLGVTAMTVGRWERGDALPTRQNITGLAQLFDKKPQELGFFSDAVAQERFSTKGSLLDPMIPLPPAQSLIGRDDLLQTIQHHLLTTSSTAIALHGLPGVGKTTMALSLVSNPLIQEAFPDGILWAALGPHPNIPEILSRWGTLLGIAASGIGAMNNSTTSWAKILRTTIGLRRMLIVLDDLWDDTDAIALHVGGSHCAYIATTRAPHIAASFAAKMAIPVPELSEDDGIVLLQLLAPEITTADTEKVRMLVRSVGSLPLALMLAGKYLHMQGYQQQPRRLRDAMERLLNTQQRLHLSEPIGLTDTHPGLASEGSLSLQTVIEVSDQHLSAFARQALRSLAIFPAKPNRFSEEAALAISTVNTEILDTLSDAGLLEIDASSRYTLHQSIADYAKGQADDENVSWRFIAYYKNYMQEHRTNIEGLELESQNLFSALEMVYALGDHATFVLMTFAMTDFLFCRGLYDQAKSHLTRAYEALQRSDDMEVIATCLHYLGMVAQKQGEYLQATEYYGVGLALACKTGTLEQRSELLSDLGWVAAKRGLYEQAYAYAREGLDLATPTHRSKLLTVLGVVADNRGEFIQAEKYYREGLLLAQQNNDQEQQCIIFNDLGVNASERGMWKEALDFYQEVRRLAIQMNHLEWQCLARLNLCSYYLAQEEYDLASQYNEEALLLTRQLGQREWESFALIIQGSLAREKKNYTQANTSLQEALALAFEIEKPHYVCDALRYLGDLALECQRIDDAADFYTQMGQFIPSGHKGLKAEYCYRLGLLAASRQEKQQAKKFGEEALAILQEIGHRVEIEVYQWIEKGCPPSLPIAL